MKKHKPTTRGGNEERGTRNIPRGIPHEEFLEEKFEIPHKNVGSSFLEEFFQIPQSYEERGTMRNHMRNHEEPYEEPFEEFF
jgi:hypothetical protein